jgi:hypothetical protein
VLFNRYQPEMTLADLKKALTKEEAQAVIAFHTKEQFNSADAKAGKKSSKKKQVKKN